MYGIYANIWGILMVNVTVPYNYSIHGSYGELQLKSSIWVFVNDLTVLPTATEPWNHGPKKGNHPKMAEQFRLVKCFNLPRTMLKSGLTV